MKHPWNVVVVTGVPGVGKTSLCRKISKELEYNYVNYGDLMLEIARSRDLASTDQEMFSLPIEEQYEIWKTAALIIKGLNQVIIDLHGLDQSKIGYILSLPVEIIYPDIIMVIEASEDKIFFRRHKDHKERIEDTTVTLKEHKWLLRTTMAICSVIFGCNLAVLKNDNFEDCLIQMRNILSK